MQKDEQIAYYGCWMWIIYLLNPLYEGLILMNFLYFFSLLNNLAVVQWASRQNFVHFLLLVFL